MSQKQLRGRSLAAKKSVDMYALLIPGILLVVLFHYVPLYGIVIAFKNYNVFAGDNPFDSILKSDWVGLRNWQVLWSQPEFHQAFRNTIVISMMKLVIGFPIPILFAIFLNEIRNVYYKKVVQTVLYLPHFMSWAITGAIFLSILGTSGIVNAVIKSLGGNTVRFFMDAKIFRWVLLLSSVWKESGWNTIVFLAAIAGISPEYYEAATVDGAERFQKMWHITLPSILSTIMMMLILRVGNMMSAGFGQVLVMYNPTVYTTGDIIDTYVYRVGLGQLNFSMGTAVGLFNSVVSFVLVISSNMLSRRLFHKSIW